MRRFLPILMLAACSGSAGNQIANGAASPASPPDRCTDILNYEHCVEFGAAERMRGTWITAFEISSFWAEGEQGADGPGRPQTWLTFAAASPPDPALEARLARMDDASAAAVRIEFIGRRARRPGHYGHMGSYEHLVIVDRIISAQILGPLRQ
jgi:hypothetical protein